jgi:hypothetical protein
MNVLNSLLEIFPISSFVIFCSCAKLFEYLEIKIKSPAYFYVFVSAEINLTHIGELKIHKTCTAIKYLVWQFYYLKGTTLIKSHLTLEYVLPNPEASISQTIKQKLIFEKLYLLKNTVNSVFDI